MPDFDSTRVIYHEPTGTYRLQGPLPNYQWFIDLLAHRYGAKNIRIALPENFGRTLRCAIYYEEDGKEYGFSLPLYDSGEDSPTGKKFDIREMMFEFLYQQGFPRKIPPVSEWENIRSGIKHVPEPKTGEDDKGD